MTFPNKWDGTSPSRPDPSVKRQPDWQDWHELTFEKMILPSPKSRYIDNASIAYNEGGLYLMRLDFTNLVINMTDAGVNGSHGSQKIFEFEPGDTHFILGDDFNLDFTADGTGVTNTADFVFGVGTVPTATDNATLTGSEANIQASVAGTFVAGVDNLTAGNVAAKTVFGDMYLNLAVPDAGSTANGTITVSGMFSFIWAPWFP